MQKNINQYTTSYLTKEQILKKYKFLSSNMLKNLLFKNINGFREKCIRKIGKRILINEIEFIKYISEQPYK